MKIPSIDYLYKNAATTLIRFPLPILSAITASFIGIYLTEHNANLSNIFPLLNSLLCLALAIPSFYCVDIISTKHHLSKKNQMSLWALVALFLVALYFTFPNSELTQNISMPYIRYGVYNALAHLLVAFAPYIFSNQLNGFWQYNKTLFIRLIVSQLYSFIIYLGLSLALFCVQLLFNIKIHEELYIDIAIVVFSVFNTWFFLAGIPNDIDALNLDYEYPKGLKIFSQYILVPLLCIYLVILYAYVTKLVLIADLPKGLVAYLVICVAVTGIFANLLLYPYTHFQLNEWIKKFSKIYYWLLIPLTILLFVAIGLRVMEYGITIPRYAIILLGIWLLMVSIYFVIGKNDIRFIPVSLSLMLLVACFGPWSMFAVSEQSQVNRLKNIFIENGILKNEKIVPPIFWKNLDEVSSDTSLFVNENKLNDSLHNEVLSIANYLESHHGFASIRPWYYQNIDSLLLAYNDTIRSYRIVSETELYLKTAGLSGSYKYLQPSDYFDFNTGNPNEIFQISGWDWMFHINLYSYGEDECKKEFVLDSTKLVLKFDHSNILIFEAKDTKQSFDLNTKIDSLKKAPKDSFTKPLLLNIQSEKLDATISIEQLSGRYNSKKNEINSINGNLYLKLKEKSR
jgi:hypothetical protein